MVSEKKFRHSKLQLRITLAFLLASAACMNTQVPVDYESLPDAPARISLTIENDKPQPALNLIAGQEYILDRIALAVENRTLKDNHEALDWLRSQSSFSVLNWDGVRETRAHWRNFRASKPDADLYSHVFEGAKWMTESNSVELSILGAQGQILGNPLRLSNQDFLNQLKQQDFDMIKAEYRYENFARHKDLSSAKVKRAVAKIVFAVQTNFPKRLVVPAAAD